jgi:hypothetical protein
MPTDIQTEPASKEDAAPAVDEAIAKDVVRKRGPLLDETDETKVAKRVLRMRERQSKAMQRRGATWKRNKLWRQGHRWVRLDRSEDKWEAKVPLGMASAPPLPNKCDRLCRRVMNTLLSDDPKSQCDPSSDSSEDTDAAEFATRVLEVEGAESGFNMVSLMKRAEDKAGTFASSFAYWYIDPTGGGRIPKQVKAHPNATVYESPEQVVLDPETRQGAKAEDYVDKYVRPDKALTAEKTEADFTWLPAVRHQLLTGHHVQFLPEAVEGISTARGVLILLPTTLGELREAYPDKFEEMDDAAIRKIVNWRPIGHKETLPEFVELQDKIDDDGKPSDDSIVFALHLYYVAHGEYPEGAHICVVDDACLCRDSHTAEVELPDGSTDIELLELPIAQCRQLDDNDDRRSIRHRGREKLGPMDEIRAQVYLYAIEHMHRFGNPHTFLPDGSIVQPKQLRHDATASRSTSTRRGSRKSRTCRNSRSVGGMLRDEMTTEENDESSLQQAAQGVEDPSVDSGIHARTIVEEAQKGLSQIRTNLGDFYVRSQRIVLQLMRVFYTRSADAQIRSRGRLYKEEAWTGSDLRSTRDVRIARGIFTMMGTSAKRQMALDEIQTGVITPEEYRELMSSSSLAPVIGLQDNPYLHESPRRARVGRKGPSKEVLELIEQHKKFQAVQQQAVEVATSVGADPQAAAMQPPAPLPSPFRRVPSDMEVRAAQIRARELSRIQQTRKFERQPVEWQQVLVAEYQQMAPIAGLMATPGAAPPSTSGGANNTAAPDPNQAENEQQPASASAAA